MDLNNQNVKRLKELILFAVLIFLGIQNFSVIIGIVKWGFHLIFPFILGSCIAFILNVPMRALERRFQLKRVLSLILTVLLVLGVVLFVLFLVMPELGKTIVMLRENMPGFFEDISSWMIKVFEENPEVVEWVSSIEINWQDIGQNVFDFFKMGAGNVLSSTFTVAINLVSGATTFFIAMVFSFYVLLQKEKLGIQVSKLLYAYMPKGIVKRFIAIASLTSKTFSNFLSGQCLEAVILGVMFFVIMSIFQFQYALMISVLVAFTALIPIFGAFFGGATGAFLIFMVDPAQAFWFIILFNVLQQIEGNFIYPHVVGNSVGLPSIWVLVAVTIGGNTMGIAGMLIFIPLISVLYTLLKESVNKRLAARERPGS